MRDPVFNPMDADYLENPYPKYRELREEHPVYFHEGMNSWVVSRYDACHQVVRDSPAFSLDFRKIGVPEPPSMVSIQTTDAPEHTGVRRVLAAALRTVDIAGVGRDVGRFAESLLAERDDLSTVDLVNEFSIPLAVEATSSMLGAVNFDEEFEELSAAIRRSMNSGLDPDAQEPGYDARAELTVFIADWYDKADSAFVRALKQEVAGSGVSKDLLFNSLRALVLGGIISNQRNIALSLHTVLNHDGLLRRYREIDNRTRAINELIRFSGPFQVQTRACVEDVEIEGQRIRTGDTVIALIAAAHRDPRQFDNPDQLILDRHPNPHLGFSLGVHVCIGARVAIMSCDHALGAMSRRFPDSFISAHPVLEQNPTMRGYQTMAAQLVA